MLPPRDLGLVMLKSQEMEPAGPLPHRPPPTASLPGSHKGKLPLSDGAQCMQCWKPLSFISYLWAQRFSISFPGTPLGKDFLGSQ